MGATLLRLALAALVLLVITRPRLRGWSATQWRAAVLFGLCLAGMNGFFYAAIDRVPLGVAVTVEFLGPLTLAALLSRRVGDLAWILLAAVGVAVLGRPGEGTGLDPLGIAFAPVSTYSAQNNPATSANAKAAAAPGQGGLVDAMGVAAVVVLPLGAHGAGLALAEPRLLLVAFGAAVLASVVPYTLQLSALRRLSAPVFGVLLSLEPAVATLAGWLLLSQDVGPVAVAAIAVVVLASVGSTVSAGPRRADSGTDRYRPEA
ncbi:MAG TPA: EamA family transporter, partial [Umezawaea sp.]|nr:EamA family transporter [Umezawaea sp.]